MQTVPQQNRSFLSIQVLRGFAALIVVAHHATQQLATVMGGSGVRAWENGAAGVDIFFVISGFVMAVSTIGREDKLHPSRVFITRRLIRLVPMYWLMTALFLFLVEYHLHKHGASPAAAGTDQVSFAAILLSSLFIPFKNTLGNVQPLLVVGWTLSYEVFFYLLFALALALRKRVVFFLPPILFLLAVVGFFRPKGWPAFTVLASPLLLEFAAGLVLGYFVLQGYRGHRWLTMAAGSAAIAVLLFLPIPINFSNLRVLEWGASAVLVVQAGISWESRLAKFFPKWLLFIGDASYSLYLSHLLVLTTLVAMLNRNHVMRFEGPDSAFPTLLVCFCVLIAVLVAAPLYVFVEKPMTEGLRRLTASSSVPRT